MLMAFMLPLMIGFTGLAVDAGYWEMSKRDLQGAVDQAAYSAAIAGGHNWTTAEATAQAKATMAEMGFSAATGVTITVKHDDATIVGIAAADLSRAWEVTATKQQDRYFSKVFLNSDPTMSAQATALNGTSQIAVAHTVTTYTDESYDEIVPAVTQTKHTDSGCILSLATSGANTSLFENNGGVSSPNCAVYTNSSGSPALKCYNNCAINSSTYTVGTQSASSNGTLNYGTAAAPKVHKTGEPPITDPYSGLPVPSSATLAAQTVRASPAGTGSVTINPGYYSAGINSSNSTINMNPGTYYIATRFNVGVGATINATGGVTLVLLNGICVGVKDGNNLGGTCATETGWNGVKLNLTAPTSGTYGGVAMFMTGGSTSTPKDQEFHNSAQLNVQGVIYAPTSRFRLHNNGTFSTSLCAQVVSYKVWFENNANMGTSCAGTGVLTIDRTYEEVVTAQTTIHHTVLIPHTVTTYTYTGVNTSPGMAK